MSLVWQAQRVVTRTRERNLAREQLLAEAEAELAKAHDMQMGLLPTDDVNIPRYDIASLCQPATHVGGDFIKYAHHGRRFYVALADVTGHGMEAAIPVVMFSGILDNHLEEQIELTDRMPRLNRSMHRTLQSRTFICCCLAEFDLNNFSVNLAMAGFPPTYHYDSRRRDLHELTVSAFPLGLRKDASYETVARPLKRGDYLVFCSDGFIEAEDPSGRILGYEQTASLISSVCSRRLTAQETLEAILADLDKHRDGAVQVDDITCVVVRCTTEETVGGD